MLFRSRSGHAAALGRARARGLSAGRHVIVPGAGHGTLAYECIASLVQDFLDGADTLEIGCADELQRPPFFIDYAGPPA